MNPPTVYNIILNTNRRDDTLECLASLSKSTYASQKIIVLDNACTDGSNQAISDCYPEVEILSLAKNKGYAGNNNVGIAAALEQGADWIFVLNEDITLDPDCLNQLLKVAEGQPEIGIVGPMVYHNKEPEVIQSAGGVIDQYWRSVHVGQNQPDHHQFITPREVDWISGCAILVRREVIQQAGALDESFFYYWEETDWCARAREKGWRVWFVPQAKIWHKGVQRDYRPGPNVTYYATRNHLMYLAKHHAPIGIWVYTLFQMMRSLFSWTFRPKWRNMVDHRNAMWQGIVDFFRHRVGMRSR